MKKFIIVAGIIFCLIFLSLAALWVLRKPLVNKTVGMLIDNLQTELGREITLQEVDFTSDEGIVITKACISQKPDFKAGKFFCTDKASIMLDYGGNSETKLKISRLLLENPEIFANEKDGHWDFEDLMNKMPKNKQQKPIEESWIIGKLILKNAKAAVKSESRKLTMNINKANIDLTHGGSSFEAKGNAEIKTELKDKTALMPVSTDMRAVFQKGELSETHGDILFENAELNKIQLSKLKLHADMMGITQPVPQKNYIMRFNVSGLVIPESDPYIYAKVPQYLKLFAAAVGRPAPIIKDAEIHDLNGHFRLENSSIELQHFSLRSNFMEMDGDMKISGNSAVSAAASNIAIGKNKLKMYISGPIKKPELKPVLSETLSRKIKQAYIEFEEFLIGKFKIYENKSN